MPAQKKQVEAIPLTQLYMRDSEHVVIASLVLNPDLLPLVNKYISDPLAFSVYTYQVIFEAITKLTSSGISPDLGAIVGYNPTALNIADLGNIVASVPEVDLTGRRANVDIVKSNCMVVRDAFIKRQIVQRMENKEEMSEIVKLLHEWEVSGRDKLFAPPDLSELLLHMMDDPMEGTVLYPWNVFNNAFGGMTKGTLTLVCARPGGGKSVFCENVASHASTIQGKRVLFASCEMTALDIVKRIATRRKGLRLFNRLEAFSEQEIVEIYQVAQELKASGLHIHELTKIEELETVLRESKREFDLIVVDYIQRLKPRQKSQSLYERATYISNELADLAKRYNIPVMAACQFNRNAEKNQPTLGDLRDSGAIEQDAFTVFSLWAETEEKTEKSHALYIDVLKNRNGVMLGNYGDSKFYLQWERPLFKLIDPPKQ